MAKEIENFHPGKFSYLRLELRDEMDEDVQAVFEEAFQFIELCKQKDEKILVHCMMGISRSATMVLMYLMRGEGMTLRDAWALTKAARPIVLPNPIFAKALVDYEK